MWIIFIKAPIPTILQPSLDGDMYMCRTFDEKEGSTTLEIDRIHPPAPSSANWAPDRLAPCTLCLIVPPRPYAEHPRRHPLAHQQRCLPQAGNTTTPLKYLMCCRRPPTPSWTPSSSLQCGGVQLGLQRGYPLHRPAPTVPDQRLRACWWPGDGRTEPGEVFPEERGVLRADKKYGHAGGL